MATVEKKGLLGIDIGGSGIKGALVDVDQGVLVANRFQVPTPFPSTPNAIAKVVGNIVEHFDYKGSIGCTFPAIIQQDIALSAANVDAAWIGTNVVSLFCDVTRQPVYVLNDADGAGVAEMVFGAGRAESGVVCMLTFGTGIGSALFIDSQLVPNTELGHLELNGREVEPWAAPRVRKNENLSWKCWAKRVCEYLQYLESIFSPDLFIIGGGVSRKSEKFFPHLKIKTAITPALLGNEAGIVGAAYLASRTSTTIR